MATNNATNVSNPLTVPQGGLGVASPTAHSIQVGNGTSAVTQLGVGATGTVVVGVTGSDPAFSATPTVTSITLSGGNTLSEYTEGTWTPTIDGATPGMTTYTSQAGAYARIGNLVVIQGSVVITAATGTGDATIGGLPFTIKNQTGGSVVGTIIVNASGWSWPASTTVCVMQGTINTFTARINCFGSTVAGGLLQMTNAAATFRFSLMYEI